MPLPSSGPISLSQVNVELGLSATAQISMNDAAVRTLFGRPSGTISMSDGYGKANEFAFAIASNVTNANLRTLAINAGWNQASKLICTINSGIYVSSNSTGTPALTISGSFPGGLEVTNNGFIIGMGGAGGGGRGIFSPSTNSGTGGGPGAAGGLALSVSSAVSFRNNGTIGGGGGGGGGGAAGWDNTQYENRTFGGAGGGGGRSSTTNSSGGAGGTASGGTAGHNFPGGPGGAGSISSAGGSGAPGTPGPGWSTRAGFGGSGGDWGAAGGGGGGVVFLNTNFIGGPFGGGSGGAAVSGNGNITWLAFGTRLGAIT